jgi:two-component system chemotaxis sensor kinase CheA
VRCGDAVFAIPLDLIEECIDAPALRRGNGATSFIDLRGKALPTLDVGELFDLARRPARRRSIVVVRHGKGRAGLLVDQLIGEYQTVIKPLGRMFREVRGISGSTILGSGEVALILDVPALIAMSSDPGQSTPMATSPPVSPIASPLVVQQP